ncbi:hypothetical protein LRS10_13275 [Phenylobacterium sp. J426]|uniref:hypothetical protein n=1 Tax=Phenylobacterium sp. J426 TaxID=2898439 RepID=UPI002151D225|nr:hypothetical protein [Phenylobacterium sp. J426]MCR5875067.1 hypothetical protein [Phenylobacterium sp. J426]
MIALRSKTRGRMALLAAAGALALGAAGCREDDRAARIAVPDPTPAALLPEPMALPYAEAAPIAWTAPDAGYRFAERAYGLEQAFYDAPPDYAFDYGGVEPWVWETADNWSMYAEPWEAGYRYYYYEPGAAYPYFVRDGLYGYGFDPSGALITLIGADGRYLPAARFADVAPLAGRYYVHGRDLRNAAAQGRRARVQEAAWIQRAPQVRRASEPWLQAARSDADWRGWREKAGKRELKRFEQEARRRERDAESWRRDARRIAAQQAAAAPAVQPDPRMNLPEVQARRDMALAQREQLRAQRDQAKQQAKQQANQQAGERGRQQAQAERQFAERQASEQRQAARQQAEAQRQAARQQARAAEDHARQAAAQAQNQARGQGPVKGGGQPDRGPKAERGGDKAGGGDRGGGKGAGKKD